MADSIQERILEEVADLHGVPAGAYNIRANGQTAGRNTTANIDIVTKTDKPGNRHPHQTRHQERKRTHPRGGQCQRIKGDGL